MSPVLENILRGTLGMFFLLFVCFLLSNNRRAINWKLVGIGIVAQICFALGVQKVNFVKSFFTYVSEKFVDLINIGHKGIEFIFGNLADSTGGWAYIFAVQVLPNIIFFAAVSAMLYYLGVLQFIVYIFAWLLKKLGISGPESVSTAANIFLGQTEAPLMIRPFLDKMNRSEIMCIMVGGFANTAGSVLAAYVGFLGGNDPDQQKFFALHMLSQSIMSAPAAIVISKIMFPQTENVMRELKVPKEKIGDNFLDAISQGTTDGLKLAVNVGAMLIVFTALMYLANYILGSVGSWININDDIARITDGRYDSLSLQMILGYIFSPVAWLIGINSHEMVQVGQLLGEKTILNEFVAYISFGQMKTSGAISDPKSILITTYALCGFANFASIGIQIGGISQLAPNQRKNLTELGVKALIGGTIACLMCGCIAGAMM
ncbi:MAG: nucleoside transporter C-terminal domain-containing protein [Candidatus Pseudobacter hemicellulosilyticus]|uniref:Nucleoside transporter C-terminal domain-containing protein n=1 Tax=Candidatus Pseudobacter hemicellulosilyticus TaxID=3121375 RepID=A0AAJ6BGR3_9BACT|nr:MAG: nucleoside transporter C-terminal domain-containing protein [Pseudobacter sp.]